MDCRTCQESLTRYAEGGLSPDERQAVSEHVRECAECRELHELVCLDPATLAALAPPDLAASILSQTSGSACGRARDLLCEQVDGTLGGLDIELLRLHLDGCADCGALVTVLEYLPSDLAAMSTLEPDARLLPDVLAATVGRRSRFREVGTRWVRVWAAALQRPRFAWEAGYVGAMTLWLLFGPTLSPLLAAPGRLAVLDSDVTANVTSELTSLGSQAWEVTSSNCAQGYRRAAGAIEGGSRRALNEISDGASTLWERFVNSIERYETKE